MVNTALPCQHQVLKFSIFKKEENVRGKGLPQVKHSGQGRALKQITALVYLPRVVIKENSLSPKHCEACGEQKGQASTLLFRTHIPLQCLSGKIQLFSNPHIPVVSVMSSYAGSQATYCQGTVNEAGTEAPRYSSHIHFLTY